MVSCADNGTGSFTVTPTGCGSATLTASGAPNIGGVLNYDLTGNVGVAQVIWAGLLNIGSPICSGCTLGASFEAMFTLTSLVIPLPCDPTFVGAVFHVQGGDLGGASGGCVIGGVDFTLTDTITTMIGG